MNESEQFEPAVRDPETFLETLLANLKPQPAIPALFVLIVSIFFPVMSLGPGAAADANGSVLMLLIPAGIAVSCGLAVAAGFCSLFPQISWIAVAVWALKFTQSGPLPAYNRWVLWAGIVIAAGMIFVQIWRVRTGKFTPTIRIDVED